MINWCICFSSDTHLSIARYQPALAEDACPAILKGRPKYFSTISLPHIEPISRAALEVELQGWKVEKTELRAD